MFKFQSRLFKRFFGETWGDTKIVEAPAVLDEANATLHTEFATIRQMKNGRFRLLAGEYGNEVIATYNRLSDARRGANRRGLHVLS